ncbi:MAG: ABC transporter ATP-binding protein [Erysipelotrichaceae bacterium]|nr:ABC transporter ATP-binding protein [Erysipelotrichaceae bacterium]
MSIANIELVNISKKFEDKIIAEEINASFDKGIYILRGENGSGKSTLLKMMMGLIYPDCGDIRLRGKSIYELDNNMKKQIGFVFSSDRTLYYKLTAKENLMYIGRIYGLSYQKLNEKVPYLLNLLNLNTNKLVETFSTGMKKRLMVARAFLCDPSIVFLDEVFNGLDNEGKDIVERLILDEANKKNITIILVSHESCDVIEESAKTVYLKEGKLYGVDSI